jgi:hypothetical protein
MKSYNLLILLAVLFVSDYAFSQNCPCDTAELSDGITGNDVIEFLCPGGELGENTQFDLSSGLVGIGNESAGYLVENFEEGGGACLVTQTDVGDAEFKLTSQEALNCRASLIEGCHLTRHPIPTLSEWGMISAAAGLGLVGVFYALRRRKSQVGA